ncbi:hypothetical protein ADK18_15245, partial [Bacillus anthracis]
FWTKEKALEALKWTVEEKEKLSSFELFQFYSVKWFAIHNFISPFVMYWNGSPYAMINSLYPNKFKEWEFSMTPNNFWTKE